MKYTIEGIKKDWDKFMWWLVENSEVKYMRGHSCEIYYKQVGCRQKKVEIIRDK